MYQYIKRTRFQIGCRIFQVDDSTPARADIHSSALFVTYPWKYFLSINPYIDKTEGLFRQNIATFFDQLEKHFKSPVPSIHAIEKGPCLHSHALIAYPGPFDDYFMNRTVDMLFGRGSTDIQQFDHSNPWALPYTLKDREWEIRKLDLFNDPAEANSTAERKCMERFQNRYRKAS